MTNLTNFASTKQSVKSSMMNNMIDKEKEEIILRRGREIKTGRIRLVPHEEVMQEMSQMLSRHEG